LSLCIYGTICATQILQTVPYSLHENSNTAALSTTTLSISSQNSAMLSEALAHSDGQLECDHYGKHEFLKGEDDQDDAQQVHFNSQEQDEQLDQPNQDKLAKSHKESTYEYEDMETEDECMASFLNPLDCCFGPVHNIFGINGRNKLCFGNTNMI
jgi:hypothetical protein